MGEVDTAGWEVCAVAGSGATFRYPPTTPEGAPVVLDEVRVHLQSRGTNEVYAEVSHHLGSTAAELYERERAIAAERLGAAADPLEETTFAGRPAWRYAFAWEGKRRASSIASRRTPSSRASSAHRR